MPSRPNYLHLSVFQAKHFFLTLRWKVSRGLSRQPSGCTVKPLAAVLLTRTNRCPLIRVRRDSLRSAALSVHGLRGALAATQLLVRVTWCAGMRVCRVWLEVLRSQGKSSISPVAKLSALSALAATVCTVPPPWDAYEDWLWTPAILTGTKGC